MKFRLRQKRPSGFTLLEVMLAASLFSVVGMMATGVFLNVSRGQQQVGSKSTLYDDAQFILDQLSKEIAGGAIDYEEYYNRIVLEGKPGMNFGHYASQFYYQLDNKKLQDCSVPSPTCVNIGKNPPASNFPEKSSAFYQSGVEGGIFCDNFEPIFSTAKGHACVTQLYVINPDGTRKTFIAPEKIYWDGSNEKKTSRVLSRAQMVVYKDESGNTIAHLFRCEKGKEMCSGELTNLGTINIKPPATITLTYPDPDDLKGVKGQGDSPVEKAYSKGKDFLPFTPSRVNIKSVRFYIGPPEDPRKAISEANEDAGTVTNVHQPRVTIALTIEPISNVKSGTSYPALTAQTTVTPGMFTEIGSYPPQMEVKKK